MVDAAALPGALMLAAGERWLADTLHGQKAAAERAAAAFSFGHADLGSIG
jgi:hypothetical protein